MDTNIIRWKDEFLIGDQQIDSQHKTLIELIEQIDDMKNSQDDGLLDKIVSYAQSHFEAEESYMEKVGYPDLDIHRKQHKKLTRILEAYKNDYDNNKINLFAFKNFLFFWVRDHIMDEDMKIGHFIRKS